MQKDIQGVKIQMSPNKKFDFDYGPGDMKAVYKRGMWQSWKQEINWLERNGEADNELTPGETIALVEDLRSLDQNKEPFVSNPTQAYQMAHKHRTANNKKYAQEHRQAMEMARRGGR